MGNHKKQHFVPQSYLRRFSKDRKRIEVYDKFLANKFTSSIRNVAQESNFNNIPENILAEANLTPEDKLVFEKGFQTFENELSSLIKKLITLPPGIKIPQKIRESFSILTAVQFLRTKHHRNLIEEVIEKFYKSVAKDFIRENFGEEAIKYTPTIKLKDKNSGVFHNQQIFDLDKLTKIAEVFYNHIWLIGMNNTEKPFYTSDNPVVMHTPLKNQIRGVGISSLGIEIAYPISSKYIFWFLQIEKFMQSNLLLMEKV